MNSFPLRLLLRSHSAIHDWDDLPASVRAVFDGTDIGIRSADFFVADPKHRKKRFHIVHSVGDEVRTTSADIVTIPHSDLAVLIETDPEKARAPMSTAFLAGTVICVTYGEHLPPPAPHRTTNTKPHAPRRL